MLSSLKKLFPHHATICEYACEMSMQARDNKGFSRAANYLTAIRSFKAAVGDMAISDITKVTIAKYQKRLEEKGLSQNTVSCYNRTLRAIYNKAVAEGLTKDRKPFATAFTGIVKTTKRSVREECLRKLRALDLGGNKRLAQARDFFIFSFYAMGMPFVDIAFLRKSQIDGDVLVYNRHKTRQQVRVPLTDEALHIINIYGTTSSPYVFPILSSTDEPKAYQEYCTRLNTYNRALKQLAKAAGISSRLTSYTVRHSWASIAYKHDVPLRAISQALGHTKPDTTMIYIRELVDDIMRRENDKVQRLIN